MTGLLPGRTAAGWAGLAATGTVAASLAAGVEPVSAILLGVAFAVSVLPVSLVARATQPAWPERPAAQDRPGWHQVAVLTRALDRASDPSAATAELDHVVRRRVEALVAARTARTGAPPGATRLLRGAQPLLTDDMRAVLRELS